MSTEDFQELTDDKTFNLVEGEKYDKSKRCKLPVKSFVRLKIVHNTELNKTPLDLFDRAVLAVAQSAWLSGQTQLTAGTIYRALTGKKSSTQYPSEKQAEEIFNSVQKLNDILVSVDMTKTNTAFNKYNDGKPLIIDHIPILPCHIAGGKFNHTDVEKIIYLDAESPLLTIAKLKKQFVNIDVTTFDTGASHNRRETISAKFYSAMRVAESMRKPSSKRSTPLSRVITFDTLFDRCRVTDAPREIKSRVRKAAEGVLANLKSIGVISSYKFIKQDGKFYSAEFKK